MPTRFLPLLRLSIHASPQCWVTMSASKREPLWTGESSLSAAAAESLDPAALLASLSLRGLCCGGAAAACTRSTAVS